jgi:alpha-ribazole phosphatase/probable phosphoglycerate mutase
VTAVDRLRAGHAGRAFAVVTHGGVARAVLAAALAMPDDAIFAIDQSYGAVNVIDWFGDRPLVRAVNGSVYAWQRT